MSTQLFPIFDYSARSGLHDAEKHQWNTVLSFGEYLLSERDAAVDFKIAEDVLEARTDSDTELYARKYALANTNISTDEWQDKIGHQFSKAVFQSFSSADNRAELIEKYLDDLVKAGKSNSSISSFTRFDAVCVYLRYVLSFELGRIMQGDELYDGLLQTFIATMEQTDRFEAAEREQLADLGRAIVAFRVARVFPCKIQPMSAGNLNLVTDQDWSRANDFGKLFEAVKQMADGKEADVSAEWARLGGIGPLLCAWLMVSPRMRKQFHQWAVVSFVHNSSANSDKDLAWVKKLFTDPSCPDASAALQAWMIVNIRAEKERLIAKSEIESTETQSLSKPQQRQMAASWGQKTGLF